MKPQSNWSCALFPHSSYTSKLVAVEFDQFAFSRSINTLHAVPTIPQSAVYIHASNYAMLHWFLAIMWYLLHLNLFISLHYFNQLHTKLKVMKLFLLETRPRLIHKVVLSRLENYLTTKYSGTSPYGHLTGRFTPPLTSPLLSPKMCSTVQIIGRYPLVIWSPLH